MGLESIPAIAIVTRTPKTGQGGNGLPTYGTPESLRMSFSTEQRYVLTDSATRRKVFASGVVAHGAVNPGDKITHADGKIYSVSDVVEIQSVSGAEMDLLVLQEIAS